MLGFKHIIKHSLVEQPEYARPVLTEMANEENKVIVQRIYSVQHVRKSNPPQTDNEMLMF